MKLIHLLIVVFNILFNIIFYIIASPFFIPFEIYKWYKNKKWRKNIKVGDRCFYINFLEKRSYGYVADISENKLKARIERKSLMGSSSDWHQINDLKIV